MTVWNVNTLTINDMVIEKEQIELRDVIDFARNCKYGKFIVKDANDGRLLNQNDFPYCNSIVIEPYNEAGIA